MPIRKQKTKLYCCPKCSKRYGSIGWMKRHLTTKNHGITFLTFYSYDTVKDMEYRLASLEHKLENLDFKNVIMNSSDFAIEKIKKEEIPKEKEANMVNLTVVIQQLNVVFKTITPGEHNIKPSELLKNLKN